MLGKSGVRWLGLVGLGILIVIWLAPAARAQRRVAPKRKADLNLIQYAGIVTNLNNISGAAWEVQTASKGQPARRSSFTLLGGYSSRWVTFKNDTLGRPSRQAWVHGLGAAVVLNNYLDRIGRGFCWSLGISGNLYFQKPVNVKTFCLFGIVSYRAPIAARWFVVPNLGFGLTGSTFWSSAASDINGFYVMGGCSVLLKL